MSVVQPYECHGYAMDTEITVKITDRYAGYGCHKRSDDNMQSTSESLRKCPQKIRKQMTIYFSSIINVGVEREYLCSNIFYFSRQMKDKK